MVISGMQPIRQAQGKPSRHTIRLNMITPNRSYIL